jgi:isopenicillin N synthase-like dioxygenase
VHLANYLTIPQEVFIIGADDDPQEPNLWLPESTVPGFRAQAVTLYDEMWKIAAEILRAVALGLGMDHEDNLLKLHSRNGNALAFRDYPPIDIAKAKDLGIPRMAPHRDFSSSVTLLFQDEGSGLEIKSPGSNEEFFQVPYIEGTFVMNIGDVLMRWSNGMLQNPLGYRFYLLSLSNIVKAFFRPPQDSLL